MNDAATRRHGDAEIYSTGILIRPPRLRVTVSLTCSLSLVFMLRSITQILEESK
jgi:hypothetical protein